jgi:hypothetical protein
MENPELMQGLIILVDGKQQHGVLEYNMDAGYVVRHQHDALGKPKLTPKGDEFAVETVYGEVTLDHTTNYPLGSKNLLVKPD